MVVVVENSRTIPVGLTPRHAAPDPASTPAFYAIAGSRRSSGSDRDGGQTIKSRVLLTHAMPTYHPCRRETKLSEHDQIFQPI
jgi:hypothetical protein